MSHVIAMLYMYWLLTKHYMRLKIWLSNLWSPFMKGEYSYTLSTKSDTMLETLLKMQLPKYSNILALISYFHSDKSVCPIPLSFTHFGLRNYKLGNSTDPDHITS